MPGEVTIDIGIDLGTTNSAIAVFDDGMSQIIKSQATSAEVTPSVVSRDGTREWVGLAAKNRLDDHPQSTFYEFKRSMGTTTTYPLPEGGRVSPDELSAAVLRLLRQDGIDYVGKDITSAVITVPAAFDTAQIAATRNAGTLAGFTHVETLQEPIAAALAYGFDQANDGWFLVFDLGGGTFDAALLSCKRGVFSVVNHRGDNDLGGGKWDSLIVDHIAVPKLEALGYQISNARERKSKTFHVLKVKAEAARIALSRKDVTSFEFDGVKDDAGNPLPDDVTVTLAEFEPLIALSLTNCVSSCRDLLAEAGVPSSTVSKVILVGGPTRTPALRRAIEELGIELATMVDPMTVVARGAAVYAASRPRPVSIASAPIGSAVFQLIYEAMVERGKDEVVVGLRLELAPAGTEVVSVRVVASDGSWDSGVVGLEDGAAVVSVKLIAAGTSTFKVTAAGVGGSPISVTPAIFSVTQAVASAPAPVNHSIGLAVDDSAGGRSFAPIVLRGATMPVFERNIYRTTREVSPRAPDADPIQLMFLEGESKVPERNLKVGEILIKWDEITRPLPANAEVEVVLRWEQGQDPEVSAYIPFLDQEIKSVLKMQNKQLPDIDALEEQVVSLRERIGDGVSASDERGKRLHEIEVRLIDARRGDTAAAHSAAAQIGPLLDAVEAESSSELKEIAISELERAEMEARDIVVKYGTPDDQRAVEELIKEARGAIAGGDHRDVDQRRERLSSRVYQVIFRQPGFWIQKFQELSEKALESTDPVTAGALIQKGRSALDRQDFDALQEVVRALWALFPDSSGSIQSFGIRVIGQ